MPATRITASRRGKRLLIAVLLLVGLMLGLAACRGFFGQAPIASLLFEIVPAGDTQVPVTVQFDISASTDPDGTIVSYDLNYGDDSTHATGTSIPTTALSHTYWTANTYTVKLTVTDNDGRIGVMTVHVTIGPLLTVFASSRGGTYGIWKMLTDGSSPAVVLDNSTRDELFPDLVRQTRDKIAYAFEDGTSWNLRTMTLAGVGIATLTNQTPSNQIQPSWSSDGAKIAYASNKAQTPSTTTWRIYTMSPTGIVNSGTVLTITQTPSWAPAYSPTDANTLLFVSTSGNTGGTAIWKWNGSTSTKLVPTSTDGYHYGDASPAFAFSTDLKLPAGAGISKPAWSPDGTKIAYSTDKDAGAYNIYVMNADGTGSQTLEAYVNSLLTADVTTGTITSTSAEFCPHWLEDDSGMVFTRETSAGVFNVYKVSFATGVVTNLTGSTSASNDNISPAAHR